MCLIAFALNASSRWPLLIASNRDELLDRPTAPLAAWTTPDGTTILSGRDLRDGGAWLGVSGTGRVAMLTNVRMGLRGPGTRSRGHLVTRWLDGHGDLQAFNADLDLPAQAGEYGGFNLVVGDWRTRQWHYLTNVHEGSHGRLHGRALADGVYGLSNAALDTAWPKTLKLKAALAAQLSAPNFKALVEAMLIPLQDRCAAALTQLPSTGISQDREQALSSPFVSLPGYGTRCSAVIAVSPGAQAQTSAVDFAEISYGDRTVQRLESMRWAMPGDPAR